MPHHCSHPARPSGVEAGFTLIEMLVVLTILGLVAALAISTLPPHAGFAARAKFRSSLEEAVSTARADAAREGRTVTVDPRALAGDAISFVPTIDSSNALEMNADGTSNGGVYSIEGRPVLAVDWMTGRISDAQR